MPPQIAKIRNNADSNENPNFRKIDTNDFQKINKDFKRVDSFQSCREYSSAELDRMLMEDQDDPETEFEKKASLDVPQFVNPRRRTSVGKLA